MEKNHNQTDETKDITIAFGHHELTMSRRYGLLYTLNDILIAVWFIIGSILFFSSATEEVGTWLFLIGSIELLIRPVIRIAKNTHLKRINENYKDDYSM